jgi:hypothetical protein
VHEEARVILGATSQSTLLPLCQCYVEEGTQTIGKAMTRDLRFVFVCLALSICYSYAAQSAQPLITGKIDDTRRVTLSGNTRPEVTAANDRGPVPDDFSMSHMMLELRRPPDQAKALEQYLKVVNDPASPEFHKWLTPNQLGTNYGPALQDVETITDWLVAQGFKVDEVYPIRTLIMFSGTAGQVRRTFHTPIHYLEVNGKPHIANMNDPQVPAALAPVIAGIVSLNDFQPQPARPSSRSARP